MHQQLVLTWLKRTLHVFLLTVQVRRRARTDSSVKQKSIGLLADGWGSTPPQTLSLCSRSVGYPPAASGHNVLTASRHVNPLPPLIMCEEGKSSLSDRWGTSSLLTGGGYCNYLGARDLGLCFLLYSNLQTFPLYCTRQKAFVVLVSGDYDASAGLCFFAHKAQMLVNSF